MNTNTISEENNMNFVPRCIDRWSMGKKATWQWQLSTVFRSAKKEGKLTQNQYLGSCSFLGWNLTLYNHVFYADGGFTLKQIREDQSLLIFDTPLGCEYLIERKAGPTFPYSH